MSARRIGRRVVRSRAGMDAVSERWLVVYEGPVWQAKVLQSQLEGHDIPTHVIEPQFQTPDFGMISALRLNVSSVLVPPSFADRASALVENGVALDESDAADENEPEAKF